MLNKLAVEIHENAKSKGFYEGKKNIGEMLCLIHSEVSEAMEADRKSHYCRTENIESFAFPFPISTNLIEEGHFVTCFEGFVKDTFEDELSDIVIRVLDLCAYKGIDIESHIKAKMKYNKTRQYKHGKKY